MNSTFNEGIFEENKNPRLEPKINILHIIKSLGRGGAETLLPETLKLHNKTKFNFHYIYFLPWKNQMVDAIEEENGKVTNFPASNNLALLFKIKDVIDYCDYNKIDLIHCHLPWSGFVGRIIHMRTKIPVIYTEHNIQEHYHWLTRLLNHQTFNFQNIALGVSEGVTKSILNNIKPEIPVSTLLNGVNTSKFRRNPKKGLEIKRSYGIPKEALVIGNVAVFREQKNLFAWIKAFEEIAKGHKEVYGILVGSGPLEKEIKELVREKGLLEKIKFAGLQKDTVAYFSAIDIFMMSSDFEGLPIALLEAMSMECAIVTTKAGGVIEAVRNNQDGLLCEIGDSSSLARLAIGLIINHDNRRILQIAARKRVEGFFSLDAMVKEIETVYNDVLKLPQKNLNTQLQDT